MQREVTDADDKLKRLYRLIEDGMTEMDDVLKTSKENLATGVIHMMHRCEFCKILLSYTNVDEIMQNFA